MREPEVPRHRFEAVPLRDGVRDRGHDGPAVDARGRDPRPPFDLRDERLRPVTGRDAGFVGDIRIRPVDDEDRPTVAWLVTELWGSALQVVHGKTYRPAELPGLIAERGGRLAGLLTYEVADDLLEIVTLNAIERGTGIGTLLIEAVAVEANRLRCHRIRLTTTNDNLDALRFYQRRGFRLVALRPGAVDRARRVKPSIPTVGNYGIPLRDELDLVRCVGAGSAAR